MLEAEPDTVERCRQCLSAEESVRAHRIKSDQLRGHFVVAHGVLRLVLSLYSDSGPRELSFQNVPRTERHVASSLQTIRYPVSRQSFNFSRWKKVGSGL